MTETMEVAGKQKPIPPNTCRIRYIAINGPYNIGDCVRVSKKFALKLIEAKKARLDDPHMKASELDSTSSEEVAKKTGSDTRTHDHTAADVAGFLAEIKDIDELVGLAEGERNHPVHPGGRKSVHAAIKSRIEDLEQG